MKIWHRKPVSENSGVITMTVATAVRTIKTNPVQDFNPQNKEHQTKGNNLVPIGGKLPYYLELQTGRVLDILIQLFQHQLPKNRSEARNKIKNWLYNRARPGCYLELGQHFHIAYGHQKDGRNTQHYWRLFFDDTLKKTIETIVNSSAMVINPQKTTTDDDNSRNGNEGLKEWGGMYFRSEAEIRLAEELNHRGLMFFANVRGMVNTASSPISKNQTTGRLEIDFFVFDGGKCFSIEVDGNHHQQIGQVNRDYARDRLLLKEQIPTARFTANECYQQPEQVVSEIIALFNHS
jgi:hypothetical protein